MNQSDTNISIIKLCDTIYNHPSEQSRQIVEKNCCWYKPKILERDPWCYLQFTHTSNCNGDHFCLSIKKLLFIIRIAGFFQIDFFFSSFFIFFIHSNCYEIQFFGTNYIQNQILLFKSIFLE